MLKSLAKAIAYSKAPVKTFAFLHPVKAIKWGGIALVAKLVYDRVRARRASQA